MKASEEEKTKQLGMSASGACRRLCRMMLFKLYKRLDEDICYRCGKKIETLKEFSLNHKRPWLHVSTDLFWDLDNIVASHGRCNTGVRRSRPKKFAGDIRTYNRKQFAEFYANPVKRDKWNARRRELYAKKYTGEDEVVESPGLHPGH